MKNNEYILIRGAREHNLKNITVKIPRNKFVVITGISGSGKSTLAFDTLYAEGQRRYIESLSAYARQFLGMMKKPDVDYIEGLSPAIAIEQRTSSKNPRSTVGTVTEIYDYLRVLFARAGTPYCPNCNIELKSQTTDEIVDTVLKAYLNKKVMLLAPVVRGRKGEYRALFEKLERKGYIRFRIDGKIYEVEEIPLLDRYKIHNIEVVVDRIVVRESARKRLADSIETCVSEGEGLCIINHEGRDHIFNTTLTCPQCGFSFQEISPRLFSFNSPYGACEECNGLGTKLEIDPEKVILHPSLSVAEGVIAPWGEPRGWRLALLKGLADRYNFDLNTPWKDLPEKIKEVILYGEVEVKVRYSSWTGSTYEGYEMYEGVMPNLLRLYKETDSQSRREFIESFMSKLPCPVCNGKRLKKEALSVKIKGLDIGDITNMQIKDSLKFFQNLKFEGKKREITREILKEIIRRLNFLKNVGVDYISLSRTMDTLSGGEDQRVRLATQIGSGLVDVIYILDEPSIGLHPRDNKKLLNTLKSLRDMPNTVIVVEHDRETILSADHIIDLGPGAGDKGGRVVAQGTPEEIMKQRRSLTGQYLSGRKKIPVPVVRRKPKGKWLIIEGASEFNLKNIDVKIPLGLFVCITGVSGSGKSTLIYETLYKALKKELYNSKDTPGKHKGIKNLHYIDKVINIDQSPIGRTPRSNPATYTNLFTYVRELFSMTPEAKIRGYKPGRFSFNVRGGRCEACQGEGMIKIEMHFLPDVYVECDVCKGKRYNRETLEIKYKGKNIHEVLEMSVDEAYSFFEHVPPLRRKLQLLRDVGLGYIKLGQPAPTLSGGEAQRVKLAKELSKIATGKTIYFLDEPTTGLHFHDVHLLLKVINRLVDKGNTVVIIEHNLEVIKSADWIIDLGPEGGDQGGYVVAEGPPEEVAKNSNSYTGRFLKEILKIS